MPRPRLPYLQRAISRHGRIVWYVRKGRGLRTRIRAPYGSAEFLEEYRAAIAGASAQDGHNAAGTLSSLIESYRQTASWTSLSPATRKQRENIFRGVVETAGNVRAADIGREHIRAGRDRRAATPYQARHFLDTMRALFRWATEAGHVKTDPTDGVGNPKLPKTPGFPAWTEADIDAYEARWPIGTKQRVWLDVLLYTGLRRGDAVRLGPQHVTNGVITLWTEKTGQAVTIPILPALAVTLAAGPCGERSFICGDQRRPFTKEAFGTAFKGACLAAGVSKSAHGVRKIGAIRAAENGATVAELEAIFGWSGGGMASLYTREADRARLARGAIFKRAKTPSPGGKVRARPRKQ